MTYSGNVELRNKLCLERVKIDTEKLPYCHNDQRLRELKARLLQIDYEIEQTYENQPEQRRDAG